jgi:hypothetical protein
MNERHSNSICYKHSSRFSEDISVICAFDKTISDLSLEIGWELADKISSIRDTIPEVWTSDLERYIDNALNNTGKNFKTAVLIEVPDELFRLYCEKVFLDL